MKKYLPQFVSMLPVHDSAMKYEEKQFPIQGYWYEWPLHSRISKDSRWHCEQQASWCRRRFRWWQGLCFGSVPKNPGISFFAPPLEYQWNASRRTTEYLVWLSPHNSGILEHLRISSCLRQFQWLDQDSIWFYSMVSHTEYDLLIRESHKHTQVESRPSQNDHQRCLSL